MDFLRGKWFENAGEKKERLMRVLEVLFSSERSLKLRRYFYALIRLVSLPVLVYIFVSIVTPAVQGFLIRTTLRDFKPGDYEFRGTKPADDYLNQIVRESANLERKLKSLLPSRGYLVVNTSENRIFLYSGGRLIHEGICSTGSYTLLKAGADQEWIFSTPKGMFSIQGKLTYPVWRKPDWAFIEEGLPVPPANSHLRFESGVLGDYALSLGDGYLIHGTLYQRFLGLPVTHGCIRLGDEDLRIVYFALQIGSKVYIY